MVIQDTRGREDSTGEWLPNYYEVEDGDDTLNWIADQKWSDGQVSMTGGSYLGYVQWSAAASGKSSLEGNIKQCMCRKCIWGSSQKRGLLYLGNAGMGFCHV